MTDKPSSSPVRARALTQMRRILALGTATGVTLGLTHCPVVCDPLPPPIQCAAGDPPSSFARYVSVGTAWAAPDAGPGAVKLDVAVSDPQSQLALVGDPTATGGTVTEVARAGNALGFVVVPDPGVQAIHVSIPLTCDGQAEAFSGVLDLAGGPGDGGTVSFVVDTGTADGGGNG